MSSRRPHSRALSQLHPIWRGIGCLLIILIPLIAYGLADFLLKYLMGQNPSLASSLLHPLPGELSQFQVQLGATVVLSILLYLVISILGSLLYSLLGGSRNAEVGSRIGTGFRR
ncbi:MAG: hypothetical protein WD751_08745 [Anaerolineales bacterium]